MDDRGRPDISVLDLTRGTTTRLTFEGQVRAPIWTLDGRRVDLRRHRRQRARHLHHRIRRQHQAAARLHDRDARQPSVDLAGRAHDAVLRTRRASTCASRCRCQPKPAKPLHESPPGQEGNAQISPDGRWVAYTSDESGRFEIYMHEFPGPGRRERVSINGAQFVRWGSEGRELIYWNTGSTGNFNVTSVSVQTTPSLQLGPAECPVHDERHAGHRLHG